MPSTYIVRDDLAACSLFHSSTSTHKQFLVRHTVITYKPSHEPFSKSHLHCILCSSNKHSDTYQLPSPLYASFLIVRPDHLGYQRLQWPSLAIQSTPRTAAIKHHGNWWMLIRDMLLTQLYEVTTRLKHEVYSSIRHITLKAVILVCCHADRAITLQPTTSPMATILNKTYPTLAPQSTHLPRTSLTNLQTSPSPLSKMLQRANK